MNKNWVLDFVPTKSEGPLPAGDILNKAIKSGYSWKVRKIQSNSGSMTGAGIVKSFAHCLRRFSSVHVVERGVGLRRLCTHYYKD